MGRIQVHVFFPSPRTRFNPPRTNARAGHGSGVTLGHGTALATCQSQMLPTTYTERSSTPSARNTGSAPLHTYTGLRWHDTTSLYGFDAIVVSVTDSTSSRSAALRRPKTGIIFFAFIVIRSPQFRKIMGDPTTGDCPGCIPYRQMTPLEGEVVAGRRPMKILSTNVTMPHHCSAAHVDIRIDCPPCPPYKQIVAVPRERIVPERAVRVHHEVYTPVSP